MLSITAANKIIIKSILSKNKCFKLNIKLRYGTRKKVIERMIERGF